MTPNTLNANTAQARATLFDRVYEQMNPTVRAAIAEQFVIALDAGHDLYDPHTGQSPAGEAVMVWATAQADRLNFSPDARLMLRHSVRAVGRRLIIEALDAVAA